MDSPTDEQLVSQVQDGDIFAFEILVKRYQQKLFLFVWRYIKDDQASQDVVQESFISFYKNIGNVDTKRKVSSYVYSIARNAAISYLRSKHIQVPLDAIEEHESETNTEEEFIRSEDKEELHRYMDRLDQKYKQVLSLYYFEELSYQEMSTKLHIPINTVRTHLKRAKEALTSLLHDENH